MSIKNIKNLTNKKFGRLTALERTDEKKHGSYVWKCICDCGNEKYTSAKFLSSGGVSSCGCLIHDSPKKRKG